MPWPSVDEAADCRCRALGGPPWWSRESNQYGERERDVLLWLGTWRGSMRWRRISGRIYTLIVADNKITAPRFCMLPERVEQRGELWGNLFAICFFFTLCSLYALCAAALLLYRETLHVRLLCGVLCSAVCSACGNLYMSIHRLELRYWN